MIQEAKKIVEKFELTYGCSDLLVMRYDTVDEFDFMLYLSAKRYLEKIKD